MKSGLDGQAGLSLLEVIAAVAIMTIVLVPTMNLSPMLLQTREKIEYRTKCIFLAQGKMEELKDKILLNFNQDYSEPAINFASPNEAYSYSVTDDNDPALKTIGVEVWHEEMPEDKIRLDTQVANRP